MNPVKIVSIGTVLPGPPIENTQIAKMMGVHQEWIDFFIGTKTRHFSMNLSTGQPLYSLSELGAEAAQKALDQAKLPHTAIEAMVLATATPEHLMPASVNLIADHLGMNHLATYQLQSGCAGAIQALDFGAQLLRSNKHKTVLVIGADVCNKFLDITQDFKKLSSNELINYVLFGDGAGAAILSTQAIPNGIIVGEIMNQFVGLGVAPGQVIQWLGSNRAGIPPNLKMIDEDYKAIAERVPILAGLLLNELLAKMHWQKSEVTYFLPPQLSKVMTDKIIHDLDLPIEKTLNCIEFTGNNGNALPFLQLEKLFAKRTANPQKAILLAIESSKWLKAGATFYV